MALVLKSNEAFNNSNLAYIERDFAIIRGVTKGMIDFSNAFTPPAGYVSGASIPATTVFKSLVEGGSDATTSGAHNLGITNGGLNGSTTTIGSNVILPASDFKPPVDGSMTRGLYILWAKLKATYASASSPNLIFGDSNSTGNNAFNFRVQYPNGGGAVDFAGFFILEHFVTATEAVDGQVHQIAAEYDRITTPGQTIIRFYLDKVLIRTVSTATVAPPSGGNNIRLFTDGSFGTDIDKTNGNKVYRAAFHNLTGRNDLSTSQLISMDWDSTKPYVS